MDVDLNTWESDFFGRRIATLTYSKENITKGQKYTICSDDYDLVSAKVEADDYGVLNTLSRSGFHYVESELLYAKKELRSTSSNNRFRPASSSDLDLLLTVADGLFIHSRFRSPWFSDEERNRFYKQWLVNAVEATFDDVCLLSLSREGEMRGFVTVRLTAQGGQIGLLGVAPTFRKRGVSRDLVEIAENWCLEQSVDELLVATQLSNVGASRSYTKSGYSLISSSIWLYC